MSQQDPEIGVSPSTIEPGLRPFIPPILLEWPDFATRTEHEVAALFIDVAGFTNLSESLALLGPEGAEVLEQTITRYFDSLLDVIEVHGGMPIRIAGDAITVLFPSWGEPLREVAVRALDCADALRRDPGDASRVSTPAGEFRLGHKIGIATGPLLTGFVGDPSLRSELVFVGAALDRAAAAEHQAKSGEVWIAPEMAALIDCPDWWSLRGPDGHRRLGDHLNRPRINPGALPRERSPLDPAALARFLHLIPDTVREHAARGALNYLCRHQSLTVLFAGCPTMTFDRPESLHALDAHYRQMQQLIVQHGGFLSEFDAGDKGAKLIAMFGAPLMLENPNEQAARCASAMQRAARELGIVTDQRIGIGTGRLYTGRIGCRTLAKYSALGDRMNVAARLMTTAEPWMVLAERAVVERSLHAVQWGASQVLKVKGKEEPIPVSALRLARAGQGRERRGAGLVGRQLERRHCSELLESVLGRKSGGLLTISGPPGIGKSRLLEAIRRMAWEHPPMTTLRWDGLQAGLQTSPFSAWAPFLMELIQAPSQASSLELAGAFQGWVATLPALLRNPAALLAPIVGVTVPVDPQLAGLPPERLRNVRIRALVDCLALEAPLEPRLLLLDDGHRLDDASLAVLLELAPQLHETRLAVVLAHRPPGPDRQARFEALRAQPLVKHLELPRLDAAESERIATRRLKVRRMDTELEALLEERAAGNPLRIESWIDVLNDTHQIGILDDTAYLTGCESMNALPDQLEALILTQFEHLPPEAQLSVRVASVIGPSLTPAEVTALHPEGISEPVVTAHLHFAAQADLLRYDRGNGRRLYFNRPEVLDAIHDSLPYHLRRTLHAHRVQLLLATLTEAPSGDLAILLAQHHVYIDDPTAQRLYFDLAVQVSQERYDHRATVHWGRRLLDLCASLKDRDGFRRTTLAVENALRQLGENEERTHLIQRWLTLAEESGDPRTITEALRARARTRQRVGDQPGACRDLMRALEIARSASAPDLLADTLFIAASVYGEVGLSLQSLEAAEEALRLNVRSDTVSRAHLLFGRGFALNQLNRSLEAYEAFHEALTLCQEAGHTWDQAIILGNLAVELWGTGHPEEGHTSLVRSLELKRQVGDRLEIGFGLVNVGYSFFRLGDLPRAITHTEDGLRQLARAGSFRGELIAVGNLGEINWLAGNLDEALRHFDRSTALLTRHPFDALQIELWLRLGELELTRNAPDAARQWFEQALERARATGNSGSVINAQEGLAEAERLAGKTDLARGWIDAALSGLEAEPLVVTFPQRIWWRAFLVASAQGRSEQARASLEQAFALLELERNRLRKQSARNRLIRAYPWNQAILAARRKPRSVGTAKSLEAQVESHC